MAAGGSLTFFEFDKDGASGVNGLAGALSATISPDGKHAYVASFTDNAVATFARNPTSGGLTFVEADQDGVGGVDGLAGASSATVSPDGKHVYVASYTDNAVATFARDATSGALTFVEFDKDGVSGVDGLGNAFSVTVSPDGAHAYVVGNTPGAVATFARNATSGALTFVEVDKDGVAGVDGLAGARSVTVSPDGKHAYVVSEVDDAVATFERDATSGALTFVEFDKDGVAGVDGLDGAFSVTVSPDGAYAYVAGSIDNAVATFERDATSGALTFVEFDKDGVAGVDGLAGARSVTVSPDGKHAYVAGVNDSAVASFERDATSGALTFLESDKDGVDGVDGLAGATSVTVSPDGKHAYVSSFTDSAVATFSRQAPDLTLTVTLSGAGSGTVTGAGINCGQGNTDCSELVAPGSTIALTATPAATSTFDSFAGAGCTTSPCIVTVDADKTVDANFDVAQRTLTVATEGAGSGTVTGTGISCGPGNSGDCTETVNDGTVIELTATPASTSTFDTFAGAGCTASPCSVTLDADKALAAYFDLKPTPTLTVSTSGTGSGTITGTGISCGPDNQGDCSETVAEGTVIELTAVAASTSTFDVFAGAGCTTSPCSVTLDADAVVDANFDLKPKTLTVTTSGAGSGTVSGSGISCGPGNSGDCSETVDAGGSIELIAEPASGSTFGAFAGAGCTTNPCSVTLDADKSVDANFGLTLGPGVPPPPALGAPPTCSAVSASTTSERGVDISLDCSDPGARALTYEIVAAPPRQHGTLGRVGDGAVTFTPNPDYEGTATFTFKAAGANTATATVTVQRTCTGLTPTIVGGPGRSTLNGTNGDDVIMGLGGNDRIRARGGDDVVCGGSGNDRIDGGSGEDRLRGGTGGDFLHGAAGNDALSGGRGRDACHGGSGTDTETTCET